MSEGADMTNRLAIIQRTNVLTIMKDLGLENFKEISDGCGIAYPTLISSLGGNPRQSPSVKTMAAVSIFLNVPVRELNKEDGDFTGAKLTPKKPEPVEPSSELTVIRMARVSIVSDDDEFKAELQIPLSQAKAMLRQALDDD